MQTFATSAEAAGSPSRIEMSGADFVESRFLSDIQIAQIRKEGYLKYNGEATYRFAVNDAGWYALWVEAAEWQTDLLVDGKPLMHMPFASGAWAPKAGKEKVANLYFAPGKHSLTFSRPWHPGLPYVRRIVLERGSRVMDMVRVTPVADHAVFRRDEPFTLTLAAARFSEPYELRMQITSADDPSSPLIRTVTIPGGTGNHSQTIDLPTGTEGVFTVRFTDLARRPVDRDIEYVVVDTKSRSAPAVEERRELVETIDPAATPPHYSSGDTRVITTNNRRILESGDSGYYENRERASWLAYRLNLPSASGFYVAEIDYPDDAERTFSISVMQDNPAPYQMDAGVITGTPYTRSGQMEKHLIYFYARQNDPRILLFNWHRGQRAGLSAIRVYRIDGPLPALSATRADRQFGFYLEEPLRYASYFGGDPSSSGWSNLFRSALRYAEWSRFVGANVWYQTVTAYQATLWPARNLTGFGPDDEGGVGNGLPAAAPSRKDFAQKDIIRLLLLVCEKYGIGLVPEIQLFPNTVLRETLATAFAANGTALITDAPPPWLSVAADGRYGLDDPSLPYFNPVYPGVQEWAQSVIRELGERYGDSPALQGVGLRFMGWAFGSWQAFASLRWGYDDYTYSRFVKETGWADEPRFHGTNRYAERFSALTGPGYRQWIDWRTSNIAGYHKGLAKTLTSIRPDLKLYLNSFGPHYSMGEGFGTPQSVEERKKKGWRTLIRETGINPDAYTENPSIILSDAAWYPAGVRAPGGNTTELGLALHRQSRDPEPIVAASKPREGGTVSHARFYNEYMEADFWPQWLGLSNRKGPDGKPMAFRLCAVLNPSGKNLLSRYADAMSAGNLISIVDGGLGYFLGQPAVLRPFLAEYRSLPSTGMRKVQRTPEGIAVWSGEAAQGNYFYAVNTTANIQSVRITFSSMPAIQRASTGKNIETNNGVASILLNPFELVALKNRNAESRIANVGAEKP